MTRDYVFEHCFPGQVPPSGALIAEHPPYEIPFFAPAEMRWGELVQEPAMAYCTEYYEPHDVEMLSIDKKRYMLHSWAIQSVPHLWEHLMRTYDPESQTIHANLHSSALTYLLPHLYSPRRVVDTPWESRHIWSIIVYINSFDFGSTVDEYAGELKEMLDNGQRGESVPFAVHAWVFFHTVCLLDTTSSRIAEERLVGLLELGKLSCASLDHSIEEARLQGLRLTPQLSLALARVREADQSHLDELGDPSGEEQEEEWEGVVEIDVEDGDEVLQSPVSSAGGFCELGPSPSCEG